MFTFKLIKNKEMGNANRQHMHYKSTDSIV